MQNFWNGFGKQASFTYGGYAMNLAREARTGAKPIVKGVSRAAQAGVAAMKKPVSDLSRKAMEGSNLLRTTKNITQI